MNRQVYMLPVIHAGPFEVMRIQMESQRPDKVQRTVKTHAKSSDRPCVMRDFRSDKYDVKGKHSTLKACINKKIVAV